MLIFVLALFFPVSIECSTKNDTRHYYFVKLKKGNEKPVISYDVLTKSIQTEQSNWFVDLGPMLKIYLK